jgi:hypothetical protein
VKDRDLPLIRSTIHVQVASTSRMKSSSTFAAFALGLVILLTGCASPGVPLPPSLELPKPATDLRALRRGDKVYLAWTQSVETTDRQTIRHPGSARICRGLHLMTVCETPVSEVGTPLANPNQTPPARSQAVDTLPPNLLTDDASMLTYAVELLNQQHGSAGLSNQVQVPLLRTLPPPSDFRATVTAEGVVLTWTAAVSEQASGLRHVYRVYRRQGPTETAVGELPYGASSFGHVLDAGMEWEKNYDYRLTVVSILASANQPEIQVEGEDSAAVQVFTHDVFPPAAPSGLQAVFSGAGQEPFVDLIWSPIPDADLAGYNVYRRDEGGEKVKLNAEPIKAAAFRDTNVKSGKTYYYVVTSLDVRGNESPASEETHEQVP